MAQKDKCDEMDEIKLNAKNEEKNERKIDNSLPVEHIISTQK